MSLDDSRTTGDGQTQSRPCRVLFVCLGNICRSPAAEIVFNAALANEGMGGRIKADSCGTAAYHCGQKPDRRMLAALERAGYKYGGHRARVFRQSDFHDFDLIIPQDHDNEADILSLARSEADRSKVRGMWNWFPPGEHRRDVPDPYYGGERGFDDVVCLLGHATAALLQDLLGKIGMSR